MSPESQNYRIFANGYFWQWKIVSKPFETYVEPMGNFIFGHLIVNTKTGKITAFYDFESITLQSLKDSYNCTVYDMENQYVLPGLHDAHIHVMNTAIGRSWVDLDGSTSLQDIAERLRDHRSRYPEQAWLIGIGWEQQRFTDNTGIMPTREFVDSIFRDIPVVLIRRCHHILCCNTLAFERANLDVNNPSAWDINEKMKSQIVFEKNIPTGIVTEDANDLFYVAMMDESPNMKQLIRNELQFLAANGIVGVQTNDRGANEIYRALDLEGSLPIRVFHTVFFEELFRWLKTQFTKQYPDVANPTLDQITEYSRHFDANALKNVDKYGQHFRNASSDSLISCDRVKIISDGSLGAKTAALRYPYLTSEEDSAMASISTSHQSKSTDDDDNHSGVPTCKCHQHFGMLRETPGTMRNKLTIIKNLGMRAEVHAIGDAGAELTINGFLEVQMTGFQHRPVLTHCQLLGADLVEFMADNQIIANIQPSFLPSDLLFLLRYLPKELFPYAYVWKKLLNRGILCSGGSDSPVEHPSPLKGIFDAIYRPQEHFVNQNMLVTSAYIKELSNDLQNFTKSSVKLTQTLENPPTPYNPEECMSFSEALQMYTVFGAYAANCDSQNNLDVQVGKLEDGYMADFIVLDQNVSQQSYKTLLEANVLQTWISGNKVFDLHQTIAYTYLK